MTALYNYQSLSFQIKLFMFSFLDSQLVYSFCFILVSEAPKEAPKAAKYSSREILSAKTDEEKKAEVRLLCFMVKKIRPLLFFSVLLSCPICTGIQVIPE